eukprot:c17742_g1_i1.p1 GENE.c17742_g1_i1~~c17742_g1_i1.p1  ORF type:complete len:722 (+),score=127.26 c17742_g1_i1:33-2168(+)
MSGGATCVNKPMPKLGQYPALHKASFLGDIDLVKSLCEDQNVDPESRGLDNETALIMACHGCQLHVVKYLVHRKVNLEAKCEGDLTPLCVACRKGALDVVCFLVEVGCDVMARTCVGLTPLHIASCNGHLDVVEYLASLTQVDINAGSFQDVSLLCLATTKDLMTLPGPLEVPVSTCGFKRNREDLVRRYNIPPEAECLVNFMRRLSRYDEEIQHIPNQGFTPLHIASCSGEFEVVRFLIERAKADITRTTVHGHTCLHVAAGGSRVEIGLFLLAAGAQIDAKALDLSEPLHIAAREAATDAMLHTLVEAGADLNAQTRDGSTPLILASSFGHVSCINVLLELGANPTILNARGESALQVSCKCNHPAAVVRWLQLPELAATANNLGSELMQIAARSGATQVLEQLIGLGFSATKPCDVNGESMLPIHIAAKEGQVSAVAHLAKANPATIRARTTRGLEPLHLACVHGHGSVVSFLIHEAHVPVNAATTDGDAPIFLAAREGSADAIRVLLGHAQCDLTAEPHTPTCLHVAALNGHVEVVESLIDAFLSDPVDVREMMMELDFLPSKRQRRLPSKAAAVNRREWRSLLTARTSEGYTATHLAVISDHVRVVRTLTTFKSRLTPPEIDTLLNGEADNHLTPLQLASYRGNAEMVEALVRKTNKSERQGQGVCALPIFTVDPFLVGAGATRSRRKQANQLLWVGLVCGRNRVC